MGDWEDAIEKAAVGEQQGEVYFDTMAGLVADVEQAEALRRCAELERQVNACLRPLVTAVGRRAVATAAELQEWTDFAHEDAAMGWEHIVRGMDEGTIGAIARYEAMRPFAPLGGDAVVDLLVMHETALHEFGVLERAGDRAAAREMLERAIGAAIAFAR